MTKNVTLVLIALCVAAVPQTLAPQSGIYITHVTVIDIDTGKEATDQTVVISNGKISDVANSKNVVLPTNAKVVDGGGKYLIPGLWDMHVHRTEYESTYPMYLVNGVTGVREMAGPFDANKFRSDLAAKKLNALHFFFASPIVDGIPPRVSDQIVVKNAEEARKVVQEQKRAGADFIKVMDRLSRDAYFGIIDEAKRQGIPVVGHVPFAISAWEASASGQKSIEHVHAVPLACSTREAELRARLVATQENSWKLWNPIYVEAYESYSDEKCQRLFAEFRKHGTWSVPTLVVYRSTAMSSDPQFRNDDRLRYFGGQMRTWLSKNAVMERKDFAPSDFAIERELLNRRKWLVGKLFRAGVPMLAGTDTPNPFCFPGFGLHDELVLMVESGVTPLGALQAATRNPAMFLNATDKYGSVSPGKIADLVLLDADPLTDIHNTTKIREVFFGGKEFDRAALDSILKNAEEEATVSQKLSPSEAQSSAPEVPDEILGDFIIKNFRFTSGEVLPELRLHYVTLGTPHRNPSGEIDNAVLLLHVTGGDGSDFLAPSFAKPLFGPGQPFDVTKFYVIIPDGIGHGRSSKPSDGLRARFPHYDYEDMVVAQYRLVTEKLGVRHLGLVMGFSMGGMQAWLWGERYPDMMDGLLPFGALPVEIAGRNRLTRRIIIEAIRHDPEWKNGDYEEQPHLAAHLAPLIAMMIGNPVRQYETYPTRAAADAWYEQIVQRAYKTDTNDKLYYYDASSDYNPSPDLEKIRAKLLLLLFADDQVNSPAFEVLDREMPRVRNGRYMIIQDGKQSNGELNNFSVELWRSYVEDFLRSLGH